jgi:hypothetical protein
MNTIGYQIFIKEIPHLGSVSSGKMKYSIIDGYLLILEDDIMTRDIGGR